MSKNVSHEQISVKDILDRHLELRGKTVQLKGVFKGWHGNCHGGPPISKSDWMTEDGTGCIYVHGTLPSGLHPMAPKDESISLIGVVHLTDKGIPYIDTTLP